MQISELIAQLEEAQERVGDLPVSTWDGMIKGIRTDICNDGIQVYNVNDANEISLEIITDG
jgi:hypothetical protein